MTYSFKNDYSEGVHARILMRLLDTNLVQQNGYGEDEYSSQAKDLLRDKMDCKKAVVFFLSGGTQTNLITLAHLLRVHEAVISAETGHISANETGAIEAVGHKVIIADSVDGKLTVSSIQNVLQRYSLRPHVVKPRVVYISNSTEIGTIYFKEELRQIAAFCKENDLILFLDGARLGHALTAENNDLSLADIACYADVFYIGGTKNGALLGEALIFSNPSLAKDFDYVVKQKGAMLAKGRVLGIQFLELFKDDLYFQLATHANKMAMKISAAIDEMGFPFLTKSTTNQIFPILPRNVIECIGQQYSFYIWKEIDDNSAAIRLITSWATDETMVDVFIADLKRLCLPS